MKKNSQIHLFIETDLLEDLKKQAREQEKSFSELCREKLIGSPKLARMEMMLEDISKKLNIQVNFSRR